MYRNQVQSADMNSGDYSVVIYYTCTKRHHDNLKTQIKRTFAPFSHLLYHITPYREMFKYILFKNDITNGIWLIVEKDRSKAFAAKKEKT